MHNPLRCIPQSAYEKPIAPYEISGLRIAWVTDPVLTEAAFQAANTSFPKPPLELRVFSDPLGQSILTSQGEEWRWQRQAVSGLFRHEDMQASVPAMSRAAAALLDRWREAVPGSTGPAGPNPSRLRGSRSGRAADLACG